MKSKMNRKRTQMNGGYMNHDNQDFTMIAMIIKITRMIFILLIYSIILAIMVQNYEEIIFFFYFGGGILDKIHDFQTFTQIRSNSIFFVNGDEYFVGSNYATNPQPQA